MRLERITVEWHRARYRLNNPFGYGVVDFPVDGEEIGAARCLAVERAKSMGADWLFFLDYDVLVAPNCLKQLLYRTKTHPGFGIYSGVYCVKERPSLPIIYKGWGHGMHLDWKIGDVMDEGITGVPMGCALLRMSAFDKLPNTPENPWFKTQCHDDENGPHGTTNEDIWYCKRLIDELGGKILVDGSPNCICGHISNATGEIFTLEPDSPPVVRAGISPPSDIEAHLPKLRELAAQCETVVEFGVRDGNSTRALLDGKPKRLISYDIEPCPKVMGLVGDRFQFIQADVETVEIPDCDLLLVDSEHTAAHVRLVLEKHLPHVQRWIVFHDTETYGQVGEDGGPGILGPIREMLNHRKWWKVPYESKEDNGLLVLETGAIP